MSASSENREFKINGIYVMVRENIPMDEVLGIMDKQHIKPEALNVSTCIRNFRYLRGQYLNIMTELYTDGIVQFIRSTADSFESYDYFDELENKNRIFQANYVAWTGLPIRNDDADNKTRYFLETRQNANEFRRFFKHLRLSNLTLGRCDAYLLGRRGKNAAPIE